MNAYDTHNRYPLPWHTRLMDRLATYRESATIAALILVMVLAFGIVGRMDYDDAQAAATGIAKASAAKVIACADGGHHD